MATPQEQIEQRLNNTLWQLRREMDSAGVDLSAVNATFMVSVEAGEFTVTDAYQPYAVNITVSEPLAAIDASEALPFHEPAIDITAGSGASHLERIDKVDEPPKRKRKSSE